jgi:hypothetical protein
MNGVPLQGAAAVVASEVQSKQVIKSNPAQNAVKQVTIGLNKQPKMVGPYVSHTYSVNFYSKWEKWWAEEPVERFSKGSISPLVSLLQSNRLRLATLKKRKRCIFCKKLIC